MLTGLKVAQQGCHRQGADPALRLRSGAPMINQASLTSSRIHLPIRLVTD